MTFRLGASDRTFKRALTYSAVFHSLLIAAIIINPRLPKSGPKGPIYYVNLGGLGGGGGGGRAAAPSAETTLTPTEVKPQSLRDLAPVQKLQEAEPKSNLRYPVDKPKREAKPKPAKKASITKPDPNAKTAPAKTPTGTGGEARSGGSGLTIGGGKPGFGEGAGGGIGGGGLADQIGMSDFPFQWYLQTVRDKISSNWFTSLVDPGVSGTFQVAVYFRIFKDGTISPVEVKESSGIKTLDQSAERAIMRSANFPPLPDGYNETYLGIILIFEHSK